METGATGGPSAWTTTPAYDGLARGPSYAVRSGAGLDGEKTGAILLFSGIFLGLVGSVFTALGWLDYTYDDHARLEWTKLLGPVMLSVGGTFLFISVCRFGMLSRRLCGAAGEEEEEVEDGGWGGVEASEPGGRRRGHSFVFDGVRHPIVFHCATVVTRHFPPPPYDSLAPPRLHPVTGDLVLGPHMAPPLTRFYPVPPPGTPGTTAQDGLPLGRSHALMSQTRTRVQGPDDGQQVEDDGQQVEETEEGNSTTVPLPPPAYEDIYRSA